MRIVLHPIDTSQFLAITTVLILTATECDEVIRMVDEDRWRHARVTDGEDAYGAVRPEVRSVVSQPLPVCEDGWPMTRVVDAIQDANSRNWRYELWGFRRSDHPSILRYDGDVQDHFRSHIDAGVMAPSRKLSFSLQLTDPSHYLGGDLVLGGQSLTGSRERGSLTIFSAVSQHQVTPVYSGRREAVVGWVHGPTFR